MKRADYIVFVLGLCLILTAFAIKNSGKLTIAFRNLPHKQAPIRLNIYRRTDNFPAADTPFQSHVIDPAGRSDISFQVPELETGEYAIVFFQDLNGDGILQKDVTGLPQEPVGFSQNYKSNALPPNFEDCKFEFSREKNKLIFTEYN